jgi:biopolymer transport protein ExbD
LIIFFMVATKFNTFEHNMRLELPKVAPLGTQTPAAHRQVVNVYQDGQIALESQLVTLEELISRLALARSHDKDLTVLVRGDAGVMYQRVAEVLAACRQAGISRLGISVHIARTPARTGNVR